MAINISIEKKDLWLISAVLIFLLGAGFAVAVWNPANHPMSHDSIDVKVNISGVDYSLQEAIDAGLLSRSFGAWKDLTATAKGGVIQGPAATDGFVVARGLYDGSSLSGYTDNTPTVSTLRLYGVVHSGGSYGTISFTMPVKKGDYWKVDGAVSSIYWIPLN